MIDSPTARTLPKRQRPVSSVILHSTGETDLRKVLRYYTTGEHQPHYLIALDGTTYRIADEGMVAWHAKIDQQELLLYHQGWGMWSQWTWPLDSSIPRKARASEMQGTVFRGYLSWRARWPALKSPLGLVTEARPNFTSVGVELLKPARPTAAIFTEEQYDAARVLVHEIAARHRFPVIQAHVLGHQDVSPLRRCNLKGGWDPGGSFDWRRIIEMGDGT